MLLSFVTNSNYLSAMDSIVVFTASFLLILTAYLLVSSSTTEMSKQCGPPTVPSIIPWLGHSFAFFLDHAQFLQLCKYVLAFYL